MPTSTSTSTIPVVDRDVETESLWRDLTAWFEAKAVPGEPVLNRVKLKYVEGSGRILCATEDIPNGTPILAVPKAALLNLDTLPARYRSLHPLLNATQLLSLYVAVSRTSSGRSNGAATEKRAADEDDEDFAPFFRSLPEGFPTTPLSWDLAPILDLRPPSTPLLQHIPPASASSPDNLLSPGPTKQALDVKRRFCEDWDVVVSCAKASTLTGQLTVGDFFWGWMSVNSRCVWWDLGLERREDNITLAPGIDMANHVIESRARTIQTPGHLTLYSSHPNGNFPSPGSGQAIASSRPSTPSSPSSIAYRNGDEVTFVYGAHDSGTLLAEYGFILPREENYYDHYDVTLEVERLFEEVCETEERDEKRAELEMNGYWGDWTIPLYDEPLEPSFRTQVALALLDARLPSAPTSTDRHPSKRRRKDRPAGLMTVEEWREGARGERELVVAADRVKTIVGRALEDLRSRLDKAHRLWDERSEKDDEHWRRSVGAVRTMLEREHGALLRFASQHDGDRP